MTNYKFKIFLYPLILILSLIAWSVSANAQNYYGGDGDKWGNQGPYTNDQRYYYEDQDRFNNFFDDRNSDLYMDENRLIILENARKRQLLEQRKKLDQLKEDAKRQGAQASVDETGQPIEYAPGQLTLSPDEANKYLIRSIIYGVAAGLAVGFWLAVIDDNSDRTKTRNMGSGAVVGGLVGFFIGSRGIEVQNSNLASMDPTAQENMMQYMSTPTFQLTPTIDSKDSPGLAFNFNYKF